MKEFFAVNLTTASSESSTVVERSLSKELEQKQTEYTEKMQAYEKKADLPMWLSVVNVVITAMGFILLMAFFSALTQVEKAEEIRLGTWIMFACGIVFLGAGIFFNVYKKQRVKKVAKDKDYIQLIKDGETLYKQSQDNLKIPANAKNIDVFLYVYQTKNGKEVPANKLFNYLNTSVKVFNEGSKVMVADMQVVFGLEKSWFKSYEVIQKTLTFNRWNKPESSVSKTYQEYKIKVNGSGVFYVKNAVRVLLEKNGETFAIVIPPYDADDFLRLAGLKRGKEKK